jgi:hypothetical protein
VYLHPKSSFTVNKEMKRQVYIAIVALAAIMLLAVPFIPHHHHDKALCTVVEHCDSDNTDNDEHTGHNDDGTACIENGGLFISKSDAHNNTSYKIIPAFVCAICRMAIAELFPEKKIPCEWEGIAIYQSAELTRTNALRAPPHISDTSYKSMRCGMPFRIPYSLFFIHHPFPSCKGA